MMVLVAVFALIAASPLFDPARLKEGSLPEGAGPQAGGGEVWLELSLTETGDVKDVLTMRETPPFTESLRRSVAQWRFEPAREGSAAVASRVLVVGVFRPPTLLGPVAGEAPHDQATASPEIPFPVNLTWPPYPPRAVGDATLLVEATVGRDGNVRSARVRVGKRPFSSAALDAVRGWRFRPASRAGKAETATVYIVLGFRSPVVGPQGR